MYRGITLVQSQRRLEFARRLGPVPVVKERDESKGDMHLDESAVVRQRLRRVFRRDRENGIGIGKAEIRLRGVRVSEPRISQSVCRVGADRASKIFLRFSHSRRVAPLEEVTALKV